MKENPKPAPKSPAEETPPGPILVTPFAISAKCTECELCVPLCPTKAIFRGVGQFVIDVDSCNGCNACPPICPERAIHPLTQRQLRG